LKIISPLQDQITRRVSGNDRERVAAIFTNKENKKKRRKRKSFIRWAEVEGGVDNILN
jgi:hypothetical protein